MNGAFQVGDRIIVNGRPEWPDPPGYRFTGAEGTVVRWVEYDEVLLGFSDYVYVRIDKAGDRGAAYEGGRYCFHADNLIKVVSASEAAL